MKFVHEQPANSVQGIAFGWVNVINSSAEKPKRSKEVVETQKIVKDVK